MFDLNSRARYLTLGALLFVAATSLTACAHSQQAPPADSASPRGQGGYGGNRMGHRGGARGDQMLEGLNLTKDQRAQITLIRDRYKLQADSMRMGSAAHDSTNRSAFRTMMTQEMGEIRAVLTPDQQKQFDDRMAKMRERRQQHDGQGGHDGPPPPNDNGSAPPPPPPPAS